MLHTSDIVRAQACAEGLRCHFESHSKVLVHTDLAQYEKDRDSPSSLEEKMTVHKTADEELEMTISFDVFETDLIGCTPG